MKNATTFKEARLNYRAAVADRKEVNNKMTNEIEAIRAKYEAQLEAVNKTVDKAVKLVSNTAAKELKVGDIIRCSRIPNVWGHREIMLGKLMVVDGVSEEGFSASLLTATGRAGKSGMSFRFEDFDNRYGNSWLFFASAEAWPQVKENIKARNNGRLY